MTLFFVFLSFIAVLIVGLETKTVRRCYGMLNSDIKMVVNDLRTDRVFTDQVVRGLDQKITMLENCLGSVSASLCMLNGRIEDRFPVIPRYDDYGARFDA